MKLVRLQQVLWQLSKERKWNQLKRDCPLQRQEVSDTYHTHVNTIFFSSSTAQVSQQTHFTPEFKYVHKHHSLLTDLLLQKEILYQMHVVVCFVTPGNKITSSQLVICASDTLLVSVIHLYVQLQLLINVVTCIQYNVLYCGMHQYRLHGSCLQKNLCYHTKDLVYSVGFISQLNSHHYCVD